MKKIKAFTLTELLVVMVVSTIVISLAFLVLTMIQKQTQNIKINLNKRQTIENLDRVLWKDFNESNTIFLKKELLSFEKELDTITYTFQEKVIIRKKDSFLIQTNNKTFFLDGLKVKNGPIDALKLEFENTYNNQELFVNRVKSASFYIN
ncbi:PulJ/GspJ family protein [Tenacibaculum singaporense]|uniref:PulJ/GspJ family protein n=1 Tax=Tenacibaculum singaporense TaxID=2358479 RepID=UPI000F667387|nr:type II secretion system protein [Tenacibaculum singaporense]RSC92204.1 type II secretion system protein [Tenacibaculum singaporense]